MRYLVYVSQAARPMSNEELAELLTRSRERNDREGLTGLLIYRYTPEEKRGAFLQLLEGEAGAVEAAWTRIAADKRHHTKIVLEEGDADGRSFPNWSMGFRNADAADMARLEGYSDLGAEGFWNRAAGGELPPPLELLKSFYEDA